MERPESFSFAPRLEWQCSDETGLEKFCLYARRDITIREREDLMQKHRDIVAYEVDYLRPDNVERDADDTPRRREMRLVAPYIVDWNATGLDADGNETPLPPPSVGGIDAFLGIDNAAYDWIVRHLLLGYKATGKAGGWHAR